MDKRQDERILTDVKQAQEAEKNRQQRLKGKRERGKTAAIVLLALLLAVQLFTSGSYSALLPLDALRALFYTQSTERETGALDAAATPLRYSVYYQGERYAIEYNAAQLQQMQQLTQSLLEDAMVSLEAVTPVLRAAYDAAFSQQGIWFGYLGRIPLHAVVGWSEPPEDEDVLSYRISSLLLVEEEEAVILYFYAWDEQQAYRALTALRPQDLTRMLSENAMSISHNAADFAFELEEESELYGETLLSSVAPEPAVYAVANPLSSGASDALLKALGFENVSDYAGANGQVYKDGGEMLRVSSSGTIEYENEGEESRYEQAGSMQEAIAITRGIMQAVEAVNGNTVSLQLLDVEPLNAGSGWILYYGYSLDGIQVYVGQLDYAARFIVEHGRVQSYLLYPRVYTALGSSGLVLPLRQALAALQSMQLQEESVLELSYREDEGMLQAGWESVREKNGYK